MGGKNFCIVKGRASDKELDDRLALDLPERSEYTNLTGYFPNEFRKIPQESAALICGDNRLTVERMSKRNIRLLGTEPKQGSSDESHNQK